MKRMLSCDKAPIGSATRIDTQKQVGTDTAEYIPSSQINTSIINVMTVNIKQ